MLSDQERERVATKAPVWAQDIIYRLDRQLAEAKQQMELLSGGPDDSNVRIRDHVYPDRLLGRDVTVDFMLPDGFIQVGHSQHDPEALEVRAIGRGHKHGLAVRPQTGNSIKLLLSEY